MFCGLGGWAEGFLAEGWDCIGFDIERHQYGEHLYPAQLVIQDVLTLHGSQFRNAALIVASPPCQAYSYRAMPWKRAKALPPPDNTLFEACFRIQREACEAAGRHIPLIVENVRGAQKWVGRARWNFGSFYLWGDVPALMPVTFSRRGQAGTKGAGPTWEEVKAKKTGSHWTNPEERLHKKTCQCETDIYCACLAGTCRCLPGACECAARAEGIKQRGSGSSGRKFASAMIAKIPEPLARHIARTFRPQS
jgi:hypothetical protein